jgi:hypothetical protein
VSPGVETIDWKGSVTNGRWINEEGKEMKDSTVSVASLACSSEETKKIWCIRRSQQMRHVI